MIPRAPEGFNMTDSNTWKISLPAATPRSANAAGADLSPAAAATAERLEAENDLSRWLSAGDIARMKDRDVAVLSTETISLATSATRNGALWKAFPDTTSARGAQELADRFRTAIEREKATAAAARDVCEELGLAWNSPALANVEAAEKSSARYGIASAELARLEKSILKWLGIRPTLRDASFLMAISASLRASDVSAMATHAGGRPEIEEAIKHLEDIDRLTAELTSEFAFDPSQHSLSAFGGIIRSFSSGRAQDFLSASRKLGIAIKGSEQAQKAAALLKKYIAAIGDATGTDVQTDGSRNAAVLARARLAQSIRRRTAIMAIDMASLTPPLPDIDLQDFGAYPGDDDLAANQDTRKLVEDNAATAPAGATISDLAAELDRRAAVIAEWTERQRRGLLFAEPGSDHAEIEDILAKNPVPLETASGLVLKDSNDLESLERHVHWLSEASMLPLSDSQLARFISHVAGLKP